MSITKKRKEIAAELKEKKFRGYGGKDYPFSKGTMICLFKEGKELKKQEIKESEWTYYKRHVNIQDATFFWKQDS